LLNVRDFVVKGESALNQATAGGPANARGDMSFSALRAEFCRQNGTLTVRNGVVQGPILGATIEGSIDYVSNKVGMSGTFIPMYGINNMFGQIPVLGIFLGAGRNEGLLGLTFEVVGTPGAPVVRVNPISALLPGVTRKLMEFNTGKQNMQTDFPRNDQRGCNPT
jgi:hypothetical protein